MNSQIALFVLIFFLASTTYAEQQCFDVSKRAEAGGVGKRHDWYFECPNKAQIIRHEIQEKKGEVNSGKCRWLPSGTVGGRNSIIEKGTKMHVHAWTDMCTWYEFNVKGWMK